MRTDDELVSLYESKRMSASHHSVPIPHQFVCVIDSARRFKTSSQNRRYQLVGLAPGTATIQVRNEWSSTA